MTLSIPTPRSRRIGPAAALLVAAVACAHAKGPEAAGEAPRAPRVLATGSHVPRPVGPDGLPITDQPLRVYRRDDLTRTGYADLLKQLRAVDAGVR